ncbi:hypothetical protein DPX16_16635 [Anabarilius grahami]|uniref:Uncharacterized protein n=1 Tax=Anabarilius grahami TaxID=495550 RepID=A0A3N0YSN2_ANAGA|nr:hypothetical protein DPX16_16635 [Anabarilius grahami]
MARNPTVELLASGTEVKTGSADRVDYGESEDDGEVIGKEEPSGAEGVDGRGNNSFSL